MSEPARLVEDQRLTSVAEQTRRARISVVMPCLDEAETIASCIAGARAALDQIGLPAEIVVADNGSSDGSPEIARALGARVVAVEAKGYGCALRAGIDAAQGDLVVMGDSDDSYDFSKIRPFIQALERGAGLVMGNRFAGGVEPGAMPWKHRWIGNPILTGIGRLFFRSGVHDFHCGLRAFTRQAYQQMNLVTTGMEFASEMVVKATLLDVAIEEVPVVLRKDGRSRPPHLRSWRDGWRHLRFMLLFSPLWLFFVPGLALFLLGLTGCVWLATGYRTIGAVEFDIHSLLLAALLCVVGYQILCFGAFAKQYAIAEGLHPPRRRLSRVRQFATVESGILLGLALAAIGAVLFVALFARWKGVAFGHLEPRETMRRAIPASLCLVVGVQTVFSSFLLGILALKNPPPE